MVTLSVPNVSPDTHTCKILVDRGGLQHTVQVRLPFHQARLHVIIVVEILPEVKTGITDWRCKNIPASPETEARTRPRFLSIANLSGVREWGVKLPPDSMAQVYQHDFGNVNLSK